MSIQRRTIYLSLAAASVVLGGLALLIPQARYSLLTAIGRNYCPVDSVWSVAGARTAREHLRERLERKSSIVREDGAFALWDADGERYWMPKGSRILAGMLAEQKLALYDSAGQTIRPGDVVLDCGANIGLYTLAALERGAARVIAIEPALDNVECLRRNTAGYVAAGRVVVYPKGVWDKDDVLPLNVQPSNSASYSVALRYKGAQPGPAVELTTVDEMVKELGLERVDYIKMDIEGAEREALAGAAGTIRRFKPRLTVSLEHRYDDPTAIPEIVRSILSEYRMAPGRCIEISAGLRPAVMSFYVEK
jgi:FkbM family methyltransferase